MAPKLSQIFIQWADFMNIHVFDTYVISKNGSTMHFDVFMVKQDLDQAIAYARQWLKEIGEENAKITAEECRFCHTQPLNDP